MFCWFFWWFLKKSAAKFWYSCHCALGGSPFAVCDGNALAVFTGQGKLTLFCIIDYPHCSDRPGKKVLFSGHRSPKQVGLSKTLCHWSWLAVWVKLLQTWNRLVRLNLARCFERKNLIFNWLNLGHLALYFWICFRFTLRILRCRDRMLNGHHI